MEKRDKKVHEMNKKILIFAPQFYPLNGGYANAIKNFVIALSEHKNINKIIVITPEQIKDKEEIKIKKTKIIRLNNKIPLISQHINSLLWIKKIKSVVKKEKINHILYETGEYPFLLLKLMENEKINKKTILRVHASTDTEVYRYPNKLKFPKNKYYQILGKVAKKAYQRTTFITSTNNYHIQFIKKEFLESDPYLCGKKTFFIIPNINQIQEKETEKSEHKNKFLTLGRLNENGFIEKGFLDLIYSVSKIAKENKEKLEKHKFIIIGTGEKKKELKQRIKKLNLEKYFELIDRLENKEVQQIQKKVKATILLSRLEGQSMFALEALSNGSPLIFSKTGGLVDLIQENKNGFFVEPQNIEDIAEKITKMMKQDERTIAQMKQNSIDLYKKKFSPKITIERFISFIEMIQ